MKRHSFFLFLVGLLALGLGLRAAVAQSHPDFTGTWKLDRAASDTADDMMKAQGMSWIVRRAARGLDITQNIRQNANSIWIGVMTSIKNHEETTPIGGPWEDKTGDDGHRIQTCTFWNDAGTALVTAVKFRMKDGTPAEIFTTRSLEDSGRTLLQLIELKCSDGRQFKARRIFRKAG